MSEIVVTKRAKSSNSKNVLDNFSKLRDFTLKGSISAQKQTKDQGINFTIMRGGDIYKVHPDGYEEIVSTAQNIEIDVIAFEPLRIAKNKHEINLE